VNRCIRLPYRELDSSFPVPVVSHTIQAIQNRCDSFTSPESGGVHRFNVVPSTFLVLWGATWPLLRTVDVPSPFTTSSLIHLAARTLNMSAKGNHGTFANLYQKRLITYHRTDSTSLSCAFKAQAHRFYSAICLASVYEEIIRTILFPNRKPRKGGRGDL
jgi:hypothetical protein